MTNYEKTHRHQRSCQLESRHALPSLGSPYPRRSRNRWHRRPSFYHHHHHLPRRTFQLRSSIPILSPQLTHLPSQDLIATVAALTLAIRVIGGSIGYTTYYNVFISKFTPNAIHYIGGAMELELGITDPKAIMTAITLTGGSLLDELRLIPGIAGNETAWEIVVGAGRVAFAESYKYVYLVSIAFGGVSIIAACFLGNINQYMDDHVAVVM